MRARATHAHTRASHPESSWLACPIMCEHVVQRSVRAWVVGGGAREETRSRAIKNTGFLLEGEGERGGEK